MRKMLLLGALLSLVPALAFGQAGFQIGQHVHIGSMNEDGTVIAVSDTLANGGTLIKVHLDRLGKGYMQQGVWVDTMVSQVSGGGGAAAPAQQSARQPAQQPAQQPAMAAPAAQP